MDQTQANTNASTEKRRMSKNSLVPGDFIVVHTKNFSINGMIEIRSLPMDVDDKGKPCDYENVTVFVSHKEDVIFDIQKLEDYEGSEWMFSYHAQINS